MWVRSSKFGTVEELSACLDKAFGKKLSYIELEMKFQECIQQPEEGVWDFVDALKELEDEMEVARSRGMWMWLLRTWAQILETF